MGFTLRAALGALGEGNAGARIDVAETWPSGQRQRWQSSADRLADVEQDG